MSNAFVAAIHSMQNDMRTMETVSQNMVNIATPGYKRAIAVAPAFGQALAQAQAPAWQAQLPAAVSSVLDLSSGTVKQTGQALDLAISGDGFFELETPEGLAYTRAGDFRRDAQGRLVSQQGFAVQGLGGALQMGPGATIDAQGRVMHDGREVGQLKLVRFADTRLLHKTGAGLLQPAAGAAGTTDPRPELQVGFLEGSNVTPMREMMALMQTTRHFEAAQKLYQGYDEALGSAIQKLGQF